MKTRRLGNLEVSTIGMGCMGFTHAYGTCPDEKEGIRLVHKAFELGCNFFDTAEMYSYFTDLAPNEGFEPEFIISVDLATTNLLSGKAAEYSDRIDLCIDHHGSNNGFAAVGYVDGRVSSCAEIIKYLFDVMGTDTDSGIADAVFTGICTDTGCFKYSSVSPATHRAAAELMEHGAQSAFICHLMFDSKSRSKILLEKMVLESLEFHCGGQLAIINITRKMMEESGARESDTDDLKVAMEELGEDYSEEEVRLVRIKFLSELAN